MIANRDRVTLDNTTVGITLTDGKNKAISHHLKRITSEDVFDP